MASHVTTSIVKDEQAGQSRPEGTNVSHPRPVSPKDSTPLTPSQSATVQGRHAAHTSQDISKTSQTQTPNDSASRPITSDGRNESTVTYVENRPWSRQQDAELKHVASHHKVDESHSNRGADDLADVVTPTATTHNVQDDAPHPYGRYDDAAHPAPSGRRQPFYDEEGQYEEFLAWKRRQGQARLKPSPQPSQQQQRVRRVHSFGRGHHPEDLSRQYRLDRRRSSAARAASIGAGDDDASYLDDDASFAHTARLPCLNWLGWTAKGHVVAFLGELVGTCMFLFFGFAGAEAAGVQPLLEQQNVAGGGAPGKNAVVLLYVALVFGFSLMINVWIFYRVSGGLFNPAVTLAMLLVRSVTPFRALLLFIAQLLGSILASGLVKAVFPSNFDVRTTLSANTSLARGVFIEAILTAELVFTIFMLAKEKHKATFLAPIGIGLALFIAHLVGIPYTGASLNPARSFGPCVVTRDFAGAQWVYWVGPAFGAVIAVVFYQFISMMQYELANPGQDESSASRAAVAAEEAKVKVGQLEEAR